MTTKHSHPIPFAILAGLASLGRAAAALVATDLDDGGTDTGFSGGFYNGSTTCSSSTRPI